MSDVGPDVGVPPTDPAPEDGSPEKVPDKAPTWAAELRDAQSGLRSDFERLAAAVTPLLTRQFADMEAKVRGYEQRLKLRQERPLIMRMATLLSDVRRIDADVDVRDHVEGSLEAILLDLGYEPFGAVGDPYDVTSFEAIGGQMSEHTVVTVVYTQGLSCFGDIILKARVEVGRPVATAARREEQQFEHHEEYETMDGTR